MWPMRLAGTARQYSGSASSQEMAMNAAIDMRPLRSSRCQYQARFMNRFEAISRRMVRMPAG